jgi:hypothetical protein
MNEPVPAFTRSKEPEPSGQKPLSDDLFMVLVEANKALMTLPATFTDCPEVRDLGVAIRSGRSRARQVVERSGGVAIAGKLMEASTAFRSTGHFRQCSMLERCAFAIAGWERRRNPRRR